MLLPCLHVGRFRRPGDESTRVEELVRVKVALIMRILALVQVLLRAKAVRGPA